MTKCQRCNIWMTAGNLCSACTDTPAQMRVKVDEHKKTQDEADYQLAKAAFTMLRWLCPPFGSDAYRRAANNLISIHNADAYMRAHNDTWHLVPRKHGPRASADAALTIQQVAESA